jgi:DNA invertase Pin-like site-specific DNA recombinase
LKRHPDVTLDATVKLADEGVSAFKGDNRRHALGQFADLARRGRVPAGSFLLIENMDRLSREKPVRAVNLLTEILLAGVRVVQLQPAELELTEDSNLFDLFKGQMEQGRGHSESQMKSERVGAAWRQRKADARESGAPVSSMCPSWLEVADGRYRLKADAARTVRAIFKWSAAGLGAMKIVHELNAAGIPPIGRRQWNRTTVQNILANRAAIGEYQPHASRDGKRAPEGEPIPNYYPAVVDDALFYAAQAARTGRTGKSGRPAGGESNPFSGLLVDALTGEKLYVASSRGWRYLIPRTAMERGADWRSFPLAPLVDGLLKRLEEVKASEVFSDPNGGKVAALAGRLEDVERRLAVATAKWEADPESSHWQAQVDKADKEKRAVVADLADARREAANPATARWAEAVALMHENDPARLRQALLSTVEGMYCVFVARGKTRLAVVQVCFVGGGRRDYLIVHRNATGGAAGERRPETTAVESARLTADLDLRLPDHARRLADALERIDVAGLEMGS